VTYRLDSADLTTVDFCRCGLVAFNAEGNGILVLGPSEASFELGWFNLATGENIQELSLVRSAPREHRYFYLALSPDRRQLLLDDLDGTVFIYEMGSGQAPVPFLTSAASPGWSPDGSKVIYASLRADGDYYSGQLMIANADGSSPELLFAATQPAGMLFPAWSPDGTQIAFVYGTQHSNRLMVVEVPESLRPGG
jgi:Tol biopolymer transport system component